MGRPIYLPSRCRSRGAAAEGHVMRTWFTRLAGGAVFLCAASAARATIIAVDFNDIAAGTINGKGAGTGVSGSWTGSAGGTVVANDLTSARYNEPQTGTA